MAGSYESLTLADMVLKAQGLLRLSQPALGELTGTSSRTVARWYQGVSQPRDENIRPLIRALLQVDGTLASAMAKRARIPLASLQTRPGNDPLLPLLVDAVVAAAAEVLELPPQRLRPALLAALQKASAAQLALPQMIDALKSAG